MKTGIIIVAAGSGERLGYGIPKAEVPLAGEPILAYALRGVIASGVADKICVAVPRSDKLLRELCQDSSITRPIDADVECPPIVAVDGGSTRSDSVRQGLSALGDDIDVVLVHDAARALAPPEVFQRVAHALAEGAQAVIPVRTMVDTVKVVEHAPADQVSIAQEVVTQTPDRTRLRIVQTPQGFTVEALARAHALAELFDDEQSAAVTDDAMLIEALGIPVYAVPGSDLSLKITTPTDLVLAEALLNAYGS
ncbi:2-C-methyl-D-erythritol 4-phosphate cytidylyltransferase [Arthrobacter sp. H14]|uniref:2-C-methyl-D-erythritol 4-phosphate cytidylyltransferase n=1 Tax=Arthrobacter sp. H14 TaxID=1312959 RepID=UPI00047C55D8|nr:2-C-methyl-D-erythritol 4-phosphate cytidylyltransferase [Arthrobacter sp. H14]